MDDAISEIKPNPPRPRRMPLGKTSRRLSFEKRLRIWLAGLSVPALVLGGLLLVEAHASVADLAAALVAFGFAWFIAASALAEQIIRPMQTLSNVVAALREDDFSFRARGARRGDALGDLALEINALAGTLQAQRSSAMEALTLLERVMTSMQSPVLAFDGQGRLRLHNASADRVFALRRPASDGRTAEELGLETLLTVTDEGMYSNRTWGPTPVRYVVRRAAFRLRGVPHVLLVLSDVGAALREEELQAWQRLIRVLGHEINNSLTPIKSIAGSLRSRLPDGPVPEQSRELHRDMARGLAVIEDRAASLNRFLQAYQQLSTLPAPKMERVLLGPMIERVAQLEQRLVVRFTGSAEVVLLADADQMQQALINLVQNGADAAIEAASIDGREPMVQIAWGIEATSGVAAAGRGTGSAPQAVVRIEDNGLGLLNPLNLFVPFYTTKPTGTGIGLALAQQIVLVHKGSISLVNRVGVTGCIAEMRLPVASE